jgi:regulator of sirC expression with transglutaminase-like and TPR domain
MRPERSVATVSSDATSRFRELIAQPEHLVPLDEVCFVIAQHAHPDLDVVERLVQLDELAASCPSPTFEHVLRHICGSLGFRGNVDDYYDPANSLLDSVLDRRTGIPISLSILVMEVARRVGVWVDGIGMPGHFIVGYGGAYADPFHGGEVIDADSAVRRFRAATGSSAEFDPRWLDPVGAHTIVLRLLSNLKGIALQLGDMDLLTWVLRLRCETPGAGEEERKELARLLARLN